ncbi:MAG: hypothetical protein SFV51_15720, partial [Bryobacteraceae bacterium]|nr:hypothetical protein [Bryobacteraceae bacterium]
ILQAKLQPLLEKAVKKITVGNITAPTGSIGGLTVDKIVLGDVTIGTLTLLNTAVNVTSGTAHLNGVKVVLELACTANWWYDIAVFSDSGTLNLGSLYFSMNVGDVQVPAFENISLAIPAVAVKNVQAAIPPIQAVDLGGAVLKTISATETTLPTAGFTLTGLGVGNLSLSTLDVPQTYTSQAFVGRFLPNHPLLLPEVQMGGIQVPTVAAGDIQSGPIDLDALPPAQGLIVDLGALGFGFQVQPILHMAIDALLMQDVELAASVQQASVQNVLVPMDIRGVRLGKVRLNEVHVADITM